LEERDRDDHAGYRKCDTQHHEHPDRIQPLRKDTEVHPEEPSDEGEREENGGDHGEDVDELSLTAGGIRCDLAEGILALLSVVPGGVPERGDPCAVLVEERLGSGTDTGKLAGVTDEVVEVTEVSPESLDDLG
jgi:hypothetical protein